jgi:hypothetical protein
LTALTLLSVTTAWEKGSAYIDAGATAVDAYDGPCEVVTSGAVNVHRRGTYVITYTAVDRSGNVARAYRRVVVR